jgi:hypothetical protein
MVHFKNSTLSWSSSECVACSFKTLYQCFPGFSAPFQHNMLNFRSKHLSFDYLQNFMFHLIWIISVIFPGTTIFILLKRWAFETTILSTRRSSFSNLCVFYFLLETLCINDIQKGILRNAECVIRTLRILMNFQLVMRVQ